MGAGESRRRWGEEEGLELCRGRGVNSSFPRPRETPPPSPLHSPRATGILEGGKGGGKDVGGEGEMERGKWGEREDK